MKLNKALCTGVGLLAGMLASAEASNRTAISYDIFDYKLDYLSSTGETNENEFGGTQSDGDGRLHGVTIYKDVGKEDKPARLSFSYRGGTVDSTILYADSGFQENETDVENDRTDYEASVRFINFLDVGDAKIDITGSYSYIESDFIETGRTGGIFDGQTFEQSDTYHAIAGDATIWWKIENEKWTFYPKITGGVGLSFLDEGTGEVTGEALDDKFTTYKLEGTIIANRDLANGRAVFFELGFRNVSQLSGDDGAGVRNKGVYGRAGFKF